MASTDSAGKTEPFGSVLLFEYRAHPEDPLLPAWEGWGEPEPVPLKTGNAALESAFGAAEARLRAEFAQQLSEEGRRSTEGGRERGRQEGRLDEQQAQAAVLAAAHQQRVRQVTELIESFSHERERYLQAVEREVVDLALGVAARILRREAQMDPLLLTGAVRVALGQLALTTRVCLRVPPAQLDLWTEAMAFLPSLAVKPTVVPGESMRLGDCLIETELGSVDIGIRAQLVEIERGFFDRAGGASPQPPSPAQSDAQHIREARA
jgi:flagellar assembly protein FliH